MGDGRKAFDCGGRFLVDLGEISDDNIVTPSPFVDMILGQEVRFK